MYRNEGRLLVAPSSTTHAIVTQRTPMILHKQVISDTTDAKEFGHMRNNTGRWDLSTWPNNQVFFLQWKAPHNRSTA